MASRELVHDTDSETNDSGMHGGGSKKTNGNPVNCDQSSLPISPPQISHIPQSDSGICLTPQSQASVQSLQQTGSLQDVSKGEEVDVSSQQSPDVEIPTPSHTSLHGVTVDSVHQSLRVSQNERPADSSAHNLQIENLTSNDSRSPTPNQSKATTPRLGRSRGNQSTDDFTYQTKYLVLQFLHQSTTEWNLLHLSQNSLSTTSESEPRFMSVAQRFRQQWQKNRSHSSPTSPQSGARPKFKPFSKMKGSKSSPNLIKDANFFKDISPGRRKTRPRPSPPSKTARGSKSTKRSPVLPKKSPVQAAADVSLIRSVSENTENSEGGTYISDADDELDTSFDSSLQGSITSQSFRNRLAHFHQQAHMSHLPTVHSEAESLAEGPLSAAEESGDDNSVLPIQSLDLSSIQQQEISTSTQYDRLNDYLIQMSQTPTLSLLEGDTSIADVTDTTLQNVDEVDLDEVDSPPFHLLSHPDQAALQPEQPQPLDQGEDGAVSGGFELHGGDNYDEAEGACGGIDVGDAEQGACGGQDGRPDRSRLTLDLCDQDAALLIDAVHSLQQDIEEEMSSFESEFEEALHSLQSDQSGVSHGLSHSRSISPDTAEIARKLARIGDDVQQRHFDHLDRAMGRLFLDSCAGHFTYETFRDAAMLAVDRELDGWRQVATLLLYSQQVALHMAQTGRRSVHRIIDYTVQLLADTAADFIIKQGGWASISSVEQSSTPSSPDHPGSLSSLFPGTVTSTTRNSTSSTITTTTAPDGSLHNRTQSSPQLSTGQADRSSVDFTDDGGRKESTRVDGGSQDAEAAASHVGSPHSTPAENQNLEQAKEGESTECEEGGDHSEVSTLASPVLLTGCAVAVLALGATVAFSLIRG